MIVGKPMKTLKAISFLTAGSAFYLLIAGAQVNAYQAALSVPDWPLSYGQILASEWPGNVFYEQHHRATAGTTLVLFAVLLIVLLRRKDLPEARQMSKIAGAALAVQVILGGLIVLQLNPPWLGAIHAVIAIATVVLIAATALLVWGRTRVPTSSEQLDRIRRRTRIALGLVALQLVLGAVTRHPPIGELTFITTLMGHLLNGVIATMFMTLLAVSMIRTPKIDRLRRWGWLLLSAVGAQVLVGSWVFVVSPQPLKESWPPPPGFPAAHAAHILLAAIIATCLVAPLLRKASHRQTAT